MREFRLPTTVGKAQMTIEQLEQTLTAYDAMALRRRRGHDFQRSRQNVETARKIQKVYRSEEDMREQRGAEVMEYIKDMSSDKQNEIRSEVERAYQFFGYRGKQRERMVAKAMESDLGAVCNLIGAYHWAMDNDDVASGITCGKTADSAIQDTL